MKCKINHLIFFAEEEGDDASPKKHQTYNIENVGNASQYINTPKKAAQ